MPPIYEPWREAPPPLRGVSGLVRDATTHAPIPGAWIAWRLPPPEVSEQVLAGARPRDPAFTMLSDDAGRFRLDRLPDDALLQSKSPRVSSKLFAVAKGYAYGALTVGLARDVLFELQPMGSVDVDVSGEDGDPPRLSVVTLRPKRGAQGSITAVALSDTIVRLRPLPPGPCEVSVDPEDGGLPVTVNVAPGRVTTVRLKRPAFLPLAGTLTMQGQTVEARLRFERTPRHVGRVFQVKTDAFGRFELRVPAGR
ncbi:MAG: carboxypeptidase regulatory-like domain-containing protein, partial [Gemmatimonadales bacterium]|nr:carboxypeptidase regulatory-like domain-containing protein [Gemmatimonadales bacterium]